MSSFSSEYQHRAWNHIKKVKNVLFMIKGINGNTIKTNSESLKRDKSSKEILKRLRNLLWDMRQCGIFTKHTILNTYTAPDLQIFTLLTQFSFHYKSVIRREQDWLQQFLGNSTKFRTLVQKPWRISRWQQHSIKLKWDPKCRTLCDWLNRLHTHEAGTVGGSKGKYNNCSYFT